jgi:hypothetical protein
MTAVTVAEVEFFDGPALTTSMHSGWLAPEVERGSMPVNAIRGAAKIIDAINGLHPE